MLCQIAANKRIILFHAGGFFLRRCGDLQFRRVNVPLVFVGLW